MTLRACVTSLLALLAAGALWAGCGGDDEEAGGAGGLEPVDVGLIGSTSDAPMWIAQERGFFADEGLTVRLTRGGASGPIILPALVSGDYDIAAAGLLAPVAATAQGLAPVRVLAQNGVEISKGTAKTGPEAEDLTLAIVSGKDDIQSVEDLAGATISVGALKSIGVAITSKWLDEQGVDVSGVEFVEVPFPDAPAAVAEGRVDAGLTIEPFVTVALQLGNHVVGRPFAEATPGLTVAGYFVTSDYADSHPEEIAAFSRAIVRANRYAESHPDEVRAVVQRNTKVPPEVAEKMSLWSWTPQIKEPAGSLRVIAEAAAEYGVIEQVPDVGKLPLE